MSLVELYKPWTAQTFLWQQDNLGWFQAFDRALCVISKKKVAWMNFTDAVKN